MKWVSNRYALRLAVLTILASIILQLVWLSQLYQAQRTQLKRDLEDAVGNAAKMCTYISLSAGHEKGQNRRDFFLSSEWLQFRQAYGNMRFSGIGGRFRSDTIGDSTIVDISLRIANQKTKAGRGRVVRWYGPGETAATAMAADLRDQKRMDSLIRHYLHLAGIDVKHTYKLYRYEDDRPSPPYTADQQYKNSFFSQQYGYNLKFLHTYQLIISSTTGAVLYRMRYYIISSAVMLILTIGAFYFIFRLMRSQQLYAQAKIAFTSNMTHELKTPVAIMEVALDAIKRDIGKEKLEYYLDISKNELHRLNLMMEKVLNLDHLDNGQVRLRFELYDVQQGLEQVIAAMGLRTPSEATSIQYIPSIEPCFVHGDPVHLSNVFYNLVDNAIKYSGPGGKVIVKCTCDNSDVNIIVEDNGPGISSAYHSQIFERFFRIQENENIHTVKGSGLGLYYVKQIIDKHEGLIKIVSDQRNGSQFIVTIPAYHES